MKDKLRIKNEKSYEISTCQRHQLQIKDLKNKIKKNYNKNKNKN